MCLGANIAEGEEYRVAGVVVLGVEVPQFLVAQVGNVLRVTAAVEVVGVGWKQLVAQPVPKDRRGRGHGPLHFVEHDAFKHQRLRAVVVLKLDPVSFLRKVERVQSREKHGIEVDIEQVAEILSVLRGERIGGPVRAGERVHKRIQRSPQHHEKRVPNRVPLTATQRRVLEDVCHARGILGHRTQGDHKHILGGITAQVQVLGPGAGMRVFLDGEIQAGDRHCPLQHKSIRDVCVGGVS